MQNPARGETIATICAASIADLDKAVIAARHSFNHGWGKLHGSERARIMYRFAELLDENAEVFGEIVTGLRQAFFGLPCRREPQQRHKVSCFVSSENEAFLTCIFP